MTEPLSGVDLDALAPVPKNVKLGGRWHKLPGDMPLPLFLRIQAYEQRADAGEDETVLLAELSDELLGLFQVHQPKMKALPDMGVSQLLGSIGAIYGAAAGEAPPPNRAARRQRKRTPSKLPAKAKGRATSR